MLFKVKYIQYDERVMRKHFVVYFITAFELLSLKLITKKNL